MKEHYDIPDFYEPEVVNVAGRFARAGDCVIDAGASVGFFTRLLSHLVGDAGSVYSFEPNQESFDHLQRNIAKHNLKNVTAKRVALWSEDLPEIKLWSVDQIGYTSVCKYHHQIGSEIVEAWTVDKLQLQPSFIKIDCELAEHEILIGAEETLKRGVDCVVLEFNFHLMMQNNMTDMSIRNYMADLGYDMFLISISDGQGGYRYPVKADRDKRLMLNGGIHINVMFSTEEKVRERWERTKTAALT